MKLKMRSVPISSEDGKDTIRKEKTLKSFSALVRVLLMNDASNLSAQCNAMDAST